MRSLRNGLAAPGPKNNYKKGLAKIVHMGFVIIDTSISLHKSVIDFLCSHASYYCHLLDTELHATGHTKYIVKSDCGSKISLCHVIMATCDSPPCEPTTDKDEEEKKTPEPETDTIEPKGYTKRDKRLEKLRQLRLRSVSCLGRH